MKGTLLAAVVGLAATAGTADAQFRVRYGGWPTTGYYYSGYQPYYGGYYSTPYYASTYYGTPYYTTYSPGVSFGFGVGNTGFYPVTYYTQPYYSTPYYPTRYSNGRGWRRW